MDELELLKNNWKKQEGDFPKLGAKEIYPMLLKKSSSIVKWIFIISILEFAISTFLNIYLIDDAFWKEVTSIHLKDATIAIYIVSYIVTAIFIYYFYKNYKSISVTDSISMLMRNILKTRKIVKYYILYVLISNAITAILFFIFMFIYPPANLEVNFDHVNWFKVIGILALMIIFILGLLFLLYSLLYGILLRKLKQNYRDLKKLEE